MAAAIIRVALSFDGKPPDASACLKHMISGIGMVTEDPARKSSGQVFVVSADRIFTTSTTTGRSAEPCVGDILVRLKTKLYPRFSYGDRIIFSGKLSEPFNFSSDGGRTFDYKGFLAKDGVFYEMKSAVVTLATSTDIAHGSPSRVTAMLLWFKRRFVGNLEHALGEPHAALAAGLVVGEKAALGSDLLEDFRIVGLIHIVVLSGFNITIVGVAMRRVLSFLPRVWGIVIGGIGIALFGVMVGGGATVIRSCFMAGVALMADLIRRDYSVMHALGFAALVMLIQNPLILLHDPSFQLSFLATLGLILLAGPIEKRLPFITDKLGMRGTVATCLATQIFVSPFILHMMGQISVIGTVVNILVLPAIPLTMLMVFLTGAVGFISQFAGDLVGWGAHLLLSYELLMVEKFARVPYAALEIPKFPGYFVLIFYALFFAVRKLLSMTAQFKLAKKSST